MNYEKIYNNLMRKAQVRNDLQGYKEVHHILPTSMGGSNDPSNLVSLTAKEHFVAHHLLSKFSNTHQMIIAFYMNKERISSNTYEHYRKLFSEILPQIRRAKRTNKEVVIRTPYGMYNNVQSFKEQNNISLPNITIERLLLDDNNKSYYYTVQ